jgi:hypothetical protein
LIAEWRTFWVPGKTAAAVRGPRLEGWEELAGQEARASIRPGDPVSLAPDYRVYELPCVYFRSHRFRRYTAETKRNYVTDIRLFLDFLWGRGLVWTQALQDDLEDFADWRCSAPDNPGRVSGAKWNRELAALTGLYD